MIISPIWTGLPLLLAETACDGWVLLPSFPLSLVFNIEIKGRKQYPSIT
jgi:hypothetical protein